MDFQQIDDAGFAYVWAILVLCFSIGWRSSIALAGEQPLYYRIIGISSWILSIALLTALILPAFGT